MRTPEQQQSRGMERIRFLHHHYDGWLVAIGVIAVVLAAIIIVGTLFGIAGNLDGLYAIQDICAALVLILGVCGVGLYIAREQKKSLPYCLTLHGDGHETNVRLLIISILAILLPIVLILLHHLI